MKPFDFHVIVLRDILSQVALVFIFEYPPGFLEHPVFSEGFQFLKFFLQRGITTEQRNLLCLLLTSPGGLCFMAVVFKLIEYLTGAVKDRFRQAGQLRHVDAIALVHAARHDFMEENHLARLLDDGNVEVFHTRQVAG